MGRSRKNNKKGRSKGGSGGNNPNSTVHEITPLKGSKTNQDNIDAVQQEAETKLLSDSGTKRKEDEAEAAERERKRQKKKAKKAAEMKRRSDEETKRKAEEAKKASGEGKCKKNKADLPVPVEGAENVKSKKSKRTEDEDIEAEQGSPPKKLKKSQRDEQRASTQHVNQVLRNCFNECDNSRASVIEALQNAYCKLHNIPVKSLQNDSAVKSNALSFAVVASTHAGNIVAMGNSLGEDCLKATLMSATIDHMVKYNNAPTAESGSLVDACFRSTFSLSTLAGKDDSQTVKKVGYGKAFKCPDRFLPPAQLEFLNINVLEAYFPNHKLTVDEHIPIRSMDGYEGVKNMFSFFMPLFGCENGERAKFDEIAESAHDKEMKEFGHSLCLAQQLKRIVEKVGNKGVGCDYHLDLQSHIVPRNHHYLYFLKWAELKDIENQTYEGVETSTIKELVKTKTYQAVKSGRPFIYAIQFRFSHTACANPTGEGLSPSVELGNGLCGDLSEGLDRCIFYHPQSQFLFPTYNNRSAQMSVRLHMNLVDYLKTRTDKAKNNLHYLFCALIFPNYTNKGKKNNSTRKFEILNVTILNGPQPFLPGDDNDSS